MIDNLDVLIAKAVDNKQEIKREGLKLKIGDSEEDFRISGIGEKTVKIEKFVKYEDMIEAAELGKENSLQLAIMKVIDEFEANGDS